MPLKLKNCSFRTSRFSIIDFIQNLRDRKILKFPHFGNDMIFLSFRFYVKSFFKNMKCVKMPIFGPLKSLKLISRKIWVARKRTEFSQNFGELLYYKIQWQGSPIANDAVVVIEMEKHVNDSIGTFGFGNKRSIY